MKIIPFVHENKCVEMVVRVGLELMLVLSKMLFDHF